MFLGRVIGTVWSTVKWAPLDGLRLLVVRPYSRADLSKGSQEPPGVAVPAAAPTHEGVVCADVLGAGIGEDVVIAYGHAARVAISGMLPEGSKPSVPIDAAVVAIVDRWAAS